MTDKIVELRPAKKKKRTIKLTRRPPSAPESKEQEALFEWASYYPALQWMFAIPNGAYLHGTKDERARQMAKLKKQGLKPGVCDVMLPFPIPPYAGLFIELKREDRRYGVSREQADFINAMRQAGYNVMICFGAMEAIQAVREYMGTRLQSPQLR